MKPEINRRIFWDVNPDKLDFNQRSRFVIERVFERGNVEDVREIRRYYGDKLIGDTLKTSPWIEEKSVYLASAILRIPLNEFVCYSKAASNPEHWIY
jgi:hypothetical protein